MRERPIRELQLSGMLCLVAGVLGAASGLVMVAVAPAVPEGRYSYPFESGVFIAIQTWFFVQHLGLLAGQWGLRVGGAAGTGRLVRWAHWVGLAGMALLSVTELLAISAAWDPYPSARTNILDAFYGISVIGIGVGMTAVGVGVIRQRRWLSWHRSVPVAIGIWAFIPMTPAIAAGYLPARLSITGWMMLYASLGWVLLSTPRMAPEDVPAPSLGAPYAS